MNFRLKVILYNVIVHLSEIKYFSEVKREKNSNFTAKFAPPPLPYLKLNRRNLGN